MVSKEVVDSGAKLTDTYLTRQANKCDPVVEQGLEALEDCLGPLASHPDEVDTAFEAVRAAQLTLYIAVAMGDDPDVVRAAQDDLKKALADIVQLIQVMRATAKEKQ